MATETDFDGTLVSSVSLKTPVLVAPPPPVVLPAKESPPEEQTTGKPCLTKDPHAQLIMVVEDDDDIRDAVVSLLVAYGFSTMSAPNRDQALRMAYGIVPAVVLLDLWMPGMEIKPFLSAIRELTPQPAIVLMTATSNAHQTARELGIEVCLAKPFTTEEMEHALQRCGLAMRVEG
jgi:CheY-like chemotaxis protein